MRRPSKSDAEVVPEADRLDGFPHPRHTVQLFGQDAAARELLAGFSSGRMHHGWLLTGAKGIGKATLAYRFAGLALSVEEDLERQAAQLTGPDDAQAMRQVRALSHPGLLLIRRTYDMRAKRFMTAISVDEVRRVRNFLAHRASTGAWRVVIVDQADELNVNAANALLKSLEEPPDRTIFLLVSSEPGRLLPTIRSRCRTLSLSELASTEMRQAAEAALEAGEQALPRVDEWAVLEQLAGGSVRRLLSLATTGGLALHEQVSTIMMGLPKVNWPQVHVLADELAPIAAEQKFETFYQLFLDALAAMIRARMLAKDGLAGWVELWETIIREKAQAKALNLDRKALILQTLGQLETVAGQAA